MNVYGKTIPQLQLQGGGISEMLAKLYRLYNSASFLIINSRFYYLNRFRVTLIWARLRLCLWQPFCKTCKLVKGCLDMS